MASSAVNFIDGWYRSFFEQKQRKTPAKQRIKNVDKQTEKRVGVQSYEARTVHTLCASMNNIREYKNRDAELMASASVRNCWLLSQCGCMNVCVSEPCVGLFDVSQTILQYIPFHAMPLRSNSNITHRCHMVCSVALSHSHTHTSSRQI